MLDKPDKIISLNSDYNTKFQTYSVQCITNNSVINLYNSGLYAKVLFENEVFKLDPIRWTQKGINKWTNILNKDLILDKQVTIDEFITMNIDRSTLINNGEVKPYLITIIGITSAKNYGYDFELGYELKFDDIAILEEFNVTLETALQFGLYE